MKGLRLHSGDASEDRKNLGVPVGRDGTVEE